MKVRSLTVGLIAIAGAIGCAAEDDSTEVSLIGTHQVPAKGERTELPPLDWTTVQARLAELGLVTATGVIEFLPLQGNYVFREHLLNQDGCGFVDASFHYNHDVFEVRSDNGKYVDSAYAGDATGQYWRCQVHGYNYRCDNFSTDINFDVLGLDARVTNHSQNFGVWSASDPSFTGVYTYDLICHGVDCDKPPASNLFGLMTGSMPCSGLDVERSERLP